MSDSIGMGINDEGLPPGHPASGSNAISAGEELGGTGKGMGGSLNQSDPPDQAEVLDDGGEAGSPT
jgi:hypothetical protein